MSRQPDWTVRDCGCPNLWKRHQWYCKEKETGMHETVRLFALCALSAFVALGLYVGLGGCS